MSATAKVQVTVEITLGGGAFQNSDVLGHVYERAKIECMNHLQSVLNEANKKERINRIQIIGEPKVFAILIPE